MPLDQIQSAMTPKDALVALGLLTSMNQVKQSLSSFRPQGLEVVHHTASAPNSNIIKATGDDPEHFVGSSHSMPVSMAMGVPP